MAIFGCVGRVIHIPGMPDGRVGWFRMVGLLGGAGEISKQL